MQFVANIEGRVQGHTFVVEGDDEAAALREASRFSELDRVTILGALVELRQEWRRVVIDADGQRVPRLVSHWYDEEIARSLLNDEYPEPTSTGFTFRLETRFVYESEPTEVNNYE